MMCKLLLIAVLAVAAVHADKDKYVYQFAVHDDNAPHEYLDTANGPMMGFNIDLINSVCDVMEKHCKFFFSKKFSTTFNSITERSVGLDNRYYDAALGWIHTIERALGYAFDAEYLKAPKSALYILRDSDRETVDFKNDKIGVMPSWFTTASCIERGLKGRFASASNIVYRDTWPELKDLLNKGEVHAIFGPSDHPSWLTGLKEMKQINCALGNTGLMHRKDEIGHLSWFGEGIKLLKKSGEFERLCKSAQVVHGLDADQCL